MDKESSYGPIIGLIIIILIIALGSVYFLQDRGDDYRENDHEAGEIHEQEEEHSQEEVLEMINTQNTSDELDSIESDLDLTNLDSVDEDLSDLGL